MAVKMKMKNKGNPFGKAKSPLAKDTKTGSGAKAAKAKADSRSKK